MRNRYYENLNKLNLKDSSYWRSFIKIGITFFILGLMIFLFGYFIAKSGAEWDTCKKNHGVMVRSLLSYVCIKNN